MKSAFKAGLRLIAPVTRLCLTVARGWDRLKSAARAQAIFDNATVVCHHTAEIKYPENIRLGQHVVIGVECALGAKATITLGDHVRLSKGVIIETAGLDFKQPAPYPHIARPIVLEDDVWVGTRAIILAGVTIGKGAIIGAGAVVSRDVPAGAVVVGQPPRVKLAEG